MLTLHLKTLAATPATPSACSSGISKGQSRPCSSGHCTYTTAPCKILAPFLLHIMPVQLHVVSQGSLSGSPGAMATQMRNYFLLLLEQSWMELGVFRQQREFPHPRSCLHCLPTLVREGIPATTAAVLLVVTGSLHLCYLCRAEGFL